MLRAIAWGHFIAHLFFFYFSSISYSCLEEIQVLWVHFWVEIMCYTNHHYSNYYFPNKASLSSIHSKFGRVWNGLIRANSTTFNGPVTWEEQHRERRNKKENETQPRRSWACVIEWNIYRLVSTLFMEKV